MIDYADLPVWPWRLLRGATERVQPTARVVNGGAALSGLTQVASMTGGGRWEVELAGIDLRTPDELRCARAWSTYLDGGAALCVVPVFDLGQAPRSYVGGRPALPGRPAPSDDYFAQEPGFGTPLISAIAGDGHDLRATRVTLLIEQGGPLRGGEHFSVNHGADGGWRLYRAGRVVSRFGAGGHIVDVRPPLRASLEDGQALEFDVPRCVMRLDPARASEFEPAVAGNRFATVTAAFVEAFG